MKEKKLIHSEAKAAFDSSNYLLAFQILWQSNVSDFIAFAGKINSKPPKENWLIHPKASEVFWDNFILQEEVFNKVFNDESVVHLFHNYYSRSDFHFSAFELKAASYYPEQFIKAIRCNQAYLKPSRIDELCSMKFDDKFRIHQKVWRNLFDTDQSLWNSILDHLAHISSLSLHEILSLCVNWIESSRYSENSRRCNHNLASTYSFFIELVFSKFPAISKENCDPDVLYSHLITNLKNSSVDYSKSLENPVARLLTSINHWINFRESLLSPYSFDLNIDPVMESELIYFNSTPVAYYNWILNGVRYDFNQFNYLMKGLSIVEELEQQGFFKIQGKSPVDVEINRALNASVYSTLILLQDLGIDSFQFKSQEIDAKALLCPLLTYSCNRLNRYENKLLKYKSKYKDWSGAFLQISIDSVIDDILREPYFFMSQKDYDALNSNAIKDLPISTTDAIVNLFSHSIAAPSVFDRFSYSYDVWLKPFLKIGDYLFCPLPFLSNNIWFYSFAQAAIKAHKPRQLARHETRSMESLLRDAFSAKQWKVKLISDQEASAIDGDIDIFIEDQDTLLLIQLKRSCFRLSLKDAYYESLSSDLKAAVQLNDAVQSLQHPNIIYEMKSDPVKWIVSTSFENIGIAINGCRKVNYFELLNAIQNPSITSLNNLIDDIVLDKNLRLFKEYVSDTELLPEYRMAFEEMIVSLNTFESKAYKQAIFSEDAAKSAAYAELFNKAVALHDSGKKNDAVLFFKKCISLNSSDGDAYAALANSLADLRLFDEAHKNFSKAISLLPNDPYILRNYSIALMESGRFYDGLLGILQIYTLYPLLGDCRRLFEKNFDLAIRQALLDIDQIIELRKKWNDLN